MADDFDEMALEYHRFPTPGKLSVEPTKRLVNQRDLALAYSPGVAAACNEIVRDPLEAANMTARGNLVAVLSNGTAVLGLGAIGALASKPVMEGKAVLFKRFAGIDVFDIEVDETDPDKLVDIIASLEPTFGGINLEDIKAPECFEVERRARERMNIPVFHDDQHGTAICVNAAVRNGLALTGKQLREIHVVCAGAGAAALACLDLLVSSGVRRENITVADVHGVIYEGRPEGMNPYNARYATTRNVRTLQEALAGADVFLGLSAPNVLQPEWLAGMAKDPLILALANPDPEIRPEAAKAARPDAIIATGRSDFPNQVNNVLCFPFIFRGALDVGATTINEEMKIAAADAIAALARAEPTDIVARAYRGATLTFGPDYILPKPFDPRLITAVAPAVAKAAMDAGVATRPLADLDAYARSLSRLVYKSGRVMEPVFEAARANPKRVAFAEGEDPRVLRAVQIVIDDAIAHPVVIGRREVLGARLSELGLRAQPDVDFTVVDPNDNAHEGRCIDHYLLRAGRKGISPQNAENWLRSRPTALGAVLLSLGEADALICGVIDPFVEHIGHLRRILELEPGCPSPAAMELVVVGDRFVFITETGVNHDPSPRELAHAARLAAKEVRRFGREPRIALVAHSDFGASDRPSAPKMRETLRILREEGVDFELDGEMRADTALLPHVREQAIRDSALSDAANVLVMPNLDTARIAASLVVAAANGLSVGPILMGFDKPAHIVSSNVTTRGVVNMTAVAVVDAQSRAEE